jgi:hypothetical protein
LEKGSANALPLWLTTATKEDRDVVVFVRFFKITVRFENQIIVIGRIV